MSASRKEAKATKCFQNTTPSDLNTRAFPEQWYGPNINSDSYPPPGGKRGTSLSRRLLCIQQLSGHFLPPSKWVSFRFPKFSIHTLKLQYLAQNLLWHGITTTAHEFCAQWRKLTISTHSCLATFYGAIFGLTLSEQWQEGKNTPGVLCDLSSHLCLAPEIGKGALLNARASNYTKRCLAI